MSVVETPSFQYVHHKFGLIVTGHGENEALPKLFKSLMTHGCSFVVLRQIKQRTGVTEKRRIEMVKTGKALPDKDVEEIGLWARGFLLSERGAYVHHVIVVDDLEQLDTEEATLKKFTQYREALDSVNLDRDRHKVSVHFLVRMLEAYYFADAKAVNSVLGTAFTDYDGDVEEIGHPKGELKKLYAGFDEREHGKAIIPQLDVPHILSNPHTCASLRTLFKWCWRSIGEPEESRFCFSEGILYDVTRGQIAEEPIS
ncbi:MAG: DUF4276 family protein [Armatimonadetes bacterium]|nr:DUF4276 family protein [Armatimonadota bacterium]